tara:strand:- start:3435 stop:3995 length:561 start_codon:yes stop_codon:yes gene_type:complete
MSDVNDVLNDIDNNVAYYNPSEDTSGKKYATIEEGTYEAVVSKLVVKKDIVVRNQYLSDIFEAIYKLDDKRYPDLKSRDVKSKGYFRFKTPDEKKYPKLEDNQGNNKGYMIFAEACGFEMTKDDSGRYLLPIVMESDIAGNPVTIKVVHDKWTDQSGEERITPVAINVFKSKRVIEKPLTEDELPF